MLQIFKDVRIDRLANRRVFIAVSVLLMLGGLFSAVIRTATGRQAFNLGVDFKGGTVATVKFKQRPGDEAIRSALVAQGVHDAIVQATDKADTVLCSGAEGGMDSTGFPLGPKATPSSSCSGKTTTPRRILPESSAEILRFTCLVSVILPSKC